ncbi:hypothetical protein CPB83DRAFT_891953 [Crepidotus variabilis]|uniref:Uncharacterized protein n=1 Tax=Crepidotus variabilis TaxID=179855 RepID=A0A9P6ELK1_9AGAR|nr:hypothetical protein CPB83DRAFT_891953 [Crepidotus variabilis]
MSHRNQTSRVAFISGPIEQPDDYFALHYEPLILEAIAAGHSFVVGPAPGTDTIALQYLIKHVADPSSITVYMAKFQAEGSLAEEVEYYQRLGANVKVEGVTTGDRDAAMTRDSDYDILRYMPVQEQKVFFGDTYYPRVSATEKNERRRRGLPLHINHELVDIHWQNRQNLSASVKPSLSIRFRNWTTGKSALP